MRLRIAFLLLCFSVWAFAQSAGLAVISGVVRDSSGGAIPNAKVTVSNDANGHDPRSIVQRSGPVHGTRIDSRGRL